MTAEGQEVTRRKKGEGCIYQRPDSPVYWMKYSRNGKTFRESTKTDNPNKAEKQLKKRLAEIMTGTFVGPQTERVRVAELGADFLREYRINGRKSIDDAQARWDGHLKPFFGMVRAVDVTSNLIARYVDERQQEGAANATVNRELAALKRMFRIGMLATPAKVLRLPGFPKLKENNVRQGFLDDAQYRKLVEGSELWFRTLVECGRTYGWRVSELIGMRVRQADLAQRTIRLEPGTTKNSEGREVVMTDAVFTLLSACAIGKGADNAVFTRKDGKPVLSFRNAWENACVKAGVGAIVCARCDAVMTAGKRCPECKTKQPRYSGLIFHDLRRTAARNLRRAGIAEGVIMKIGGWKTRSVFERYAIVSRTDIVDAMRMLQQTEKALEAATVTIGHENGHAAQKTAAQALPAPSVNSLPH
jgi:integrase